MRTVIAIAMTLASVPVLAEHEHDGRQPVDLPPAYTAECGSCHVAFPPGLLSADDWRRVLSGLDKHYGDDATLDAATRARVESFVTTNAGGDRRTAGAGKPPRITATTWFKREHDEVPSATWRDARVKSAANCSACHTRADRGSYRERDIMMPGGQRRRHEEDR